MLSELFRKHLYVNLFVSIKDSVFIQVKNVRVMYICHFSCTLDPDNPGSRCEGIVLPIFCSTN